ncbi:MAG: MATE family efflux transporter [Oscillospiraceae bacterium]|nr:MATE family efflux transporter [Oscillospiraceae bacterium]
MNRQARLQSAAENRDLTRGPITKKILIFSLPIILGNLFQQLYNVVDSVVVGNFAADGTHCLAAVNASFAVMMVFNSLYMGVSMGANIVISQYKGAKDEKKLQDAMTTTFVLSMLAGLFITVAGFLAARPMLRMLGTPADILDDAVLYIRIIFLGTCGNVIYNNMNGMVQGLGDAKWPMYALVVSSITNILLDLLFVCVFHWDVAGVAVATILAHIFSGCLMLWRQSTGVYGARIDFRRLRINGAIARHVVRLGLPSALQNMCFAGGSLIIQTFSNRFGTEFIAANSMLMKIDGFVLLPMMGFSTAVTTYVGQNIGAGDVDRTNRGIRSTLLLSAGVTVFLSVILWFVCPSVTLIFGANANSRQMAAQGIRFVCFFYVFYSLQSTYSGALRGAGAALMSALCSIGSTLVRVPLSWLLAALPLNRALDAAVAAGQYADRTAAEAAKVGFEHYIGIFQTWGWSMLAGLLLILPCYLFGHWREKGVTDQARKIGK